MFLNHFQLEEASLPFPTYNKSAADDFENILSKERKISIYMKVYLLTKVENIVV